MFTLFVALLACKDAPEVVWTRDVKPIVDANCVACHSAGNIAPFPLTTYAETAPLSTLIASAVEDRRMPPYPPAQGCNEYQDDHSLSDEEIATLLAWADAGAPEGDAADTVDGEPELGQQWTGDLELPMPTAFTPTLSPDQYRCFVLDWPYEDQKYVTGLRVNPGNLAIVHHVIAFTVSADQVLALQALDDNDPGEGYDCFGGPGVSDSYWVGGWVPGSAGQLSAEGVGIPIDPGAKIVVQLHYNLDSGNTDSDLSTLVLKLEDDVEFPARIAKILDPSWVIGDNMLIPAGDSSVSFSFEFPNPTRDVVRLWSAGLHMHQLGASGRLSVIDQSGNEEECLLDIPRWDFHWQGSYQFVEPVELDATDSVRITCEYDNSSGTSDVSWGEGTADEMCLGMLYASF